MTIARNDHLFAEKLAAKRRVSALERRIVSREHAATTCRFMQTQIADILQKLEPQDARADQMDPAVVDSVKALRQSFVSLVQELDMYGTVPDFKNADNIRKIATKSSSIPKPKPVTKKVIEAAGCECLGIVCVVDRTRAEAPSPIPILASALKLDLPNYLPEECPICKEGKLPLVHLGSRKMKEQAKQTL